MALLKVVGADFSELPMELLINSTTGRRKLIGIDYADVKLPLISEGLHGFYTLTDMVDAGEKLGKQMGALLPYLWRGERHYISGAVVGPLGRGLLTVPFGFFDGRV